MLRRLAIPAGALIMLCAMSAASQRVRFGEAGFRGGGWHHSPMTAKHSATPPAATHFREIPSPAGWMAHRVHPRWGNGLGCGLSPSWYGGYGYSPFLYPNYRTAPYGCGMNLLSLPYSCRPWELETLPAYGLGYWSPHAVGPQASWDPGYTGLRRTGGAFADSDADDGSVLPTLDMRRVRLNYDGHERVPGSVLTITSGQHQLVVSAAPREHER